MKIKTYGGVAAFAAALIVSTSCQKQASQSASAAASPPAAPVRVAVSEMASVPFEIATVGNVEASTTISVKALVSGTLMKVHIADGRMVKVGDPLFDIWDKPYLEAIRRLEANIARDKALLKQNEATLASAEAQDAHYGKQADRYTKLADQGIFSRELADQAAVEARARKTAVRAQNAGLDSLKAALLADEAALANARLDLSYCYLKSPVNGRAGAVKMKAGNLVKANDQELLVIHQIQPVYVSFAVPEEHLAQVRRRVAAGLGVHAIVPGDDRGPVTGRLDFIDNQVDAATGTIRLRGTFANADARLWPGQFVDVKLRLEDRPSTVTVPAAAIQTGQQGYYVYVVRPDSTVDLRVVKPGPRMAGRASIVEGLNAGETVVTEGQLRLAPGMKVKANQG
ncbi:MAG: efflux RND transporter periplasmic adaptor subunit [Bryobacteraceae bacterium]